MKQIELADLDIPRKFLDSFRKDNISKLYPPQVEAIQKGLFSGGNLVLAMPTASGKTLLATLAMIKHLTSHNKKAVYIVPLIALANEKYNYYKNLFGDSFKVAVSVGDLDSKGPWLKDYNVVVATSEKLDSLIRHDANWIRDIGLIVIDEIHLLNDAGRGPTLEILISLLRKLLPKAQILALSATIGNSSELSRWLDAELVTSTFRPVTLYEGVCFQSKIKFLDKPALKLDDIAEEGIVQDTIKNLKKQALIFVSSRRNAEGLAERLSHIVGAWLTPKEREKLKSISQLALKRLEVPTRQCKRLSLVLRNGVAFHHAGLISKQKILIEDNFRQGNIKLIVATPTLAFGLNLPAFRVLVRDLKRYYAGRGSCYIPVLEYKQFAGRAGRPQYDKFGEAILLAKSEQEADEFFEQYISAEPESIESKLAQEATLRMHTLSLISQGFCNSCKSLLEFLSTTFFGFQYDNIYLIEEKIAAILNDLKTWDFIYSEKDKIKPTALGKRISQLYLDPKSAHFFIECLKNAQNLGMTELGILQMISYVDEVHPLLSVKTKDLELLTDVVSRNKEKFLIDVPLFYDEDYSDFLRSVKTSLCFFEWMNEKTEDKLLDTFQVTPGELHGKLEVADWLLYCILEIVRLIKYQTVMSHFRRLRVRLHYGIKEELLELVSLRDIGRVRARRLFNAGIRDFSMLRSAKREKLKNILGPNISEKVLRQVVPKETLVKRW